MAIKPNNINTINTNSANIQAEILALYGRCRAKGGFGGDRRVSPQVVQETLDENPDDENSDGIIQLLLSVF
jgi:hypothetical protein